MFFDIAFAFLIFLFALRGSVVGLVRQAFVLVRVVTAVIGALVMASHFSSIMLKFAPSDEHLRWWLSFLLIFFGIWFFIFCLGLSFSSFLKTVEVTFLDRLVGFVVGAICGLIVCVIITMFLISQPFIDVVGFVKNSYILKAFESYAKEFNFHGLVRF